MEWELWEDEIESLTTSGGSYCVVSKIRQRGMWKWCCYYRINRRDFRVRGIAYTKDDAKNFADWTADLIEEGIPPGPMLRHEYEWRDPKTGETEWREVYGPFFDDEIAFAPEP